MSRFLLSAASIFVLLITSLVLPHSADARRCEERMPLTLLSLYRTSDAIYIGRYEKNEDGEVTEETPEYRVVPIKKHFSISSALKGEPRKLLTIEDTEYRYKNVAASGEADGVHGDEVPLEEIARPGDPVMLFVSKDAESGVLNLTEMSDGIKKMTPERMSAYETRIKELKGILSAEKPKYSKLVDWMIRCAQNPLTRWEGTFELLQSFQNVDWQEERARQPQVEIVSGVTEEFVPEVPKDFETGDLNFARNLTDAHKRELTNILMNRERPKKTESGEETMVNGDRELIELVKRWGDSRVASNLLEQLRHDHSDPEFTAELMQSVAAILRDDQLTTISEEYSNVRWEIDEEEVRVEDGGEPAGEVSPAPDAVVGPMAPLAETAADQPVEVVDDVQPRREPGESKKKKTYAELRTELFAKFIARADLVINRERNKNTAKLNR